MLRETTRKWILPPAVAAATAGPWRRSAVTVPFTACEARGCRCLERSLAQARPRWEERKRATPVECRTPTECARPASQPPRRGTCASCRSPATPCGPPPHPGLRQWWGHWVGFLLPLPAARTKCPVHAKLHGEALPPGRLPRSPLGRCGQGWVSRGGGRAGACSHPPPPCPHLAHAPWPFGGAPDASCFDGCIGAQSERPATRDPSTHTVRLCTASDPSSPVVNRTGSGGDRGMRGMHGGSGEGRPPGTEGQHAPSPSGTPKAASIARTGAPCGEGVRASRCPEASKTARKCRVAIDAPHSAAGTVGAAGAPPSASAQSSPSAGSASVSIGPRPTACLGGRGHGALRRIVAVMGSTSPPTVSATTTSECGTPAGFRGREEERGPFPEPATHRAVPHAHVPALSPRAARRSLRWADSGSARAGCQAMGRPQSPGGKRTRITARRTKRSAKSWANGPSFACCVVSSSCGCPYVAGSGADAARSASAFVLCRPRPHVTARRARPPDPRYAQLSRQKTRPHVAKQGGLALVQLDEGLHIAHLVQQRVAARIGLLRARGVG